MASKLVIVCSDVRLNSNLVTVTVTGYQIIIIIIILIRKMIY